MTCSQLSCLIELKRLSEKTPGVASVCLTKTLKLSKPSVHRLLEGLKGMGLIEKEYYGEARLTDRGSEVARRMENKLNVLTNKLDGIVKNESAYDAALVLLSGLSEENFSCFEAQIGE